MDTTENQAGGGLSLQDQLRGIMGELDGGETMAPDDETLDDAPEEEGAEEEPEEGADPDGDEIEEEPEEGEEPEEAEPAEITTLQDFAKAAGYSPEDLYGLQMKLSDGTEVPLGEVKDRLQELPKLREQLEQERGQIEQSRQETLQRLQALDQIPQAVMQSEAYMQSLAQQWEQLKERESEMDSGDFVKAQSKLRDAFEEAQQTRSQALRAAQQYQQEQLRERLQAEAKKAREAIPGWRDDETVKADLAAMAQTAAAYGFSEQEFGSVSDHRLHKLMRDLTYLRREKALAEKALGKKQSFKPRVVKGRTTRARDAIKQQSVNALRERAAAGSDRDKAAYIGTLIS